MYEVEDFTTQTAGAKLLGIDISKIFENNIKAKNKISRIIENEVKKEEKSALINQILETHRSFNYEQVMKSLNNFISGLNA